MKGHLLAMVVKLIFTDTGVWWQLLGAPCSSVPEQRTGQKPLSGGWGMWPVLSPLSQGKSVFLSMAYCRESDRCVGYNEWAKRCPKKATGLEETLWSAEKHVRNQSTNRLHRGFMATTMYTKKRVRLRWKGREWLQTACLLGEHESKDPVKLLLICTRELP